MNVVIGFKSTGAIWIVFTSGRAYINMVFVISVVSLCDYLIMTVNFNFKKSFSNTLCKVRNRLGYLDDESKMPRSVQEKLEIYKKIDENLVDINNINLGEKKINSFHKENENTKIQKQTEEKDIAAYLGKSFKNVEKENIDINNNNKYRNKIDNSNNQNKIEEENAIELYNIELKNNGEDLKNEEEYQIRIIKNKINTNFCNESLKHKNEYGFGNNNITKPQNN